VVEDLIQENVLLAGVNQHGDHRQLALVILVNEMRHHRIVVPVELLLARPVKVKLHQIVVVRADGDATAPGRDVHLE